MPFLVGQEVSQCKVDRAAERNPRTSVQPHTRLCRDSCAPTLQDLNGVRAFRRPGCPTNRRSTTSRAQTAARHDGSASMVTALARVRSEGGSVFGAGSTHSEHAAECRRSTPGYWTRWPRPVPQHRCPAQHNPCALAPQYAQAFENASAWQGADP